MVIVNGLSHDLEKSFVYLKIVVARWSVKWTWAKEKETSECGIFNQNILKNYYIFDNFVEFSCLFINFKAHFVICFCMYYHLQNVDNL